MSATLFQLEANCPIVSASWPLIIRSASWWPIVRQSSRALSCALPARERADALSRSRSRSRALSASLPLGRLLPLTSTHSHRIMPASAYYRLLPRALQVASIWALPRSLRVLARSRALSRALACARSRARRFHLRTFARPALALPCALARARALARVRALSRAPASAAPFG